MQIVVKDHPLTYAEKTYQAGETLTASDQDGVLLCQLNLAKNAPRRQRGAVGEAVYETRRLQAKD